MKLQTMQVTRSFHWKFFSTGNQPQGSKSPKEETEFEKALREAKDENSKAAMDAGSTGNATSLTVPPQKQKRLWDRIKEEALHYWHGSKLLYSETVISSRLLRKLLKGSQLSRREYRQLKRTTGDLLRLVPFIIIVLIPFLEFALPILLRLFPNMLPSTFESKFQEEEKKKNLLKVRIKMAKFLQETVGEVALSGTSKADAAKEFSDFFSKVG
jgi:LETM1 and EF-hand domain-containing protein 1